MTKVHFVKMKRMTPNPLDNLTEIEVHPDAVASHMAAGWYVAPHQEQSTSEGSVEVPEELKGKLPEDFPGYAALVDAGIHTYAQLRKAGDITEVPGIRKATAAKIAEAIAVAPETD
jgi:hypothetical protein